MHIEDKIKEVIKQLQIPDQFRDDAGQEAYLAYLEGREITEALRYWWEKESQFLINHF